MRVVSCTPVVRFYALQRIIFHLVFPILGGVGFLLSASGSVSSSESTSFLFCCMYSGSGPSFWFDYFVAPARCGLRSFKLKNDSSHFSH